MSWLTIVCLAYNIGDLRKVPRWNKWLRFEVLSHFLSIMRNKVQTLQDVELNLHVQLLYDEYRYKRQ